MSQLPDASAEPPPKKAHNLHRVSWGADLERSRPGSRYGVVLVLLLATFTFMATGPTGSWVPLVTVLLQGATLLAALAAAEASRRLVRFSLLVVGVGIVSGIAALIADSDTARGGSALLNFLLVIVAPIAIVSTTARKRSVDVQTVLGAICIYVFIGMAFVYIFTTIGNWGSHSFFVQTQHPTTADYLYFSFVTLTTVGYGDFTAATGLGRAVAIFDALLGQLYLVTVLALLVSRFGRSRDSGDN